MNLLKEVQLAGSMSGRDVDKFEKCGLTPFDSIAVKAPGVKECAAHIECKVIDTKEAGDHTLFIGKIVYFFGKYSSCDFSFSKANISHHRYHLF
jgi:flavin reductase (DIM6/NTAB) family NADH-FMN oxidoreductase RutF